MAKLLSVHPVVNVGDVKTSMAWYCRHLGFEPLFVDDGDNPNYGGLGRDGVEIHLQWHSPEEWSAGLKGSAYRFLVDDPDQLFADLGGPGTPLDGRSVDDTTWGTREFGLYDPDGNALFFYRDR